MANHLKVAVVDSIYTLQAQGLSQRQIARLLGINRETVRRHLRLAESNPAGAPLGSESSEPGPLDPDAGPNPARAPIGSGVSSEVIQPSACEPFREAILAKLEQGLSATRIYQDLVADCGFAARYHSASPVCAEVGEGRFTTLPSDGV